MIEYTKEDSIVIIRINRPEARGALTVEGNRELEAAFKSFKDDNTALVAIVTGTGEKAFCAGADIGDMLPFIKNTADNPGLQPATIMRGMNIWKPIIAAVNGLTLGGGLELILACDIRIASENATFGFPETRVGIFPCGGGTQRLPRLVPPGIAAEMIYTGRIIDVNEAYHWGLVNKIVPLGNLMPTAMEMAKRIAEGGQIAIRAAKESLITGMSIGLEAGLQFEASLVPRVVSSRDFVEGCRAFMEKRKPAFENKQE